MKIGTITNLYPRPDQPNRGLFNARQFVALAQCRGNGQHSIEVRNVCLVPEWRLWRWPAIRKWSDPFATQLHTRYVPTFYVPVVGRNLGWRAYRRAVRGTGPCLEECDALLATWLYPDAVAAACVAHDRGIPLWIKAHGTDRFHLCNSYRRRRILWAADLCRGIICNCRFMAEQLEALGLPRYKLHVVPNGVDTSRFTYRTREEARHLLRKEVEATGYGAARMAVGFIENPVRRKVILFVGNLLPIKGPDVLLEACGHIFRKHIMHVLMIGSGRMHKQLQRRLWELGLAHIVLFLGERPHTEIPLWMNVADVLAVPSRSEGMPNVVFEALASGLPVAATDVGGCAEYLAGEKNCRIVPPEAPVALANALDELLTVQVDRPALAQRHAGGLSWKASAEKLVQLIGLCNCAP